MPWTLLGSVGLKMLEVFGKVQVAFDYWLSCLFWGFLCEWSSLLALRAWMGSLRVFLFPRAV